MDGDGIHVLAIGIEFSADCSQFLHKGQKATEFWSQFHQHSYAPSQLFIVGTDLSLTEERESVGNCTERMWSAHTTLQKNEQPSARRGLILDSHSCIMQINIIICMA